MLATLTQSHDLFGKLLIGKVNSGFIYSGDSCISVDN